MTYGLILIKGKAEKRTLTLAALVDIAKQDNRKKHASAWIQEIFLSFGWTDFVLLIKAKNIEQIRYKISNIRKKLANHDDYVETSTIICSTPSEMKEKKKEWAELL